MTYVKIYEETSRKFTAQVKININHNTTLEQNEDIIKEAKQQCMVRTINKIFSNITGEEEKPWFCEKIKRDICIRKTYNRERRNEQDQCKREMLGKNTWNKRKRHKNLLKNKLTYMKVKLLMTLEKRNEIRNYGTLSTH